jgi:carbon monoxide dehydrogenase subunit G
MLLNLSENLELAAAPDDVWKVLRDTPRLAGLLPGVESVKALDEAGMEAYAATVHDKIGPFKVTLNLEIRVVEAAEPSLLKASLKGLDSGGANRVSGSLQVALEPLAVGNGSGMRFEANVEVLGKLATLGAIPMRRRTAQLFAEFAGNIQKQFAAKE